MYFTQLPDHTQPGFDEQSHFGRFKKHNMIFNARGSQAHCDKHVGCLSFKTVLGGEEWYGIDGHHIAVRPGQFLVLNDDQPYSCRIPKGEPADVLSIFFKKEFARAIFHDASHNEETLLDDPANPGNNPVEFFQTLYSIEPELQTQLTAFIIHLETQGYDSDAADEHLIFILRYLILTHRSQQTHTIRVDAQKPSTRLEIFKRLCIAKDLLHSSYKQPLDLQTLSRNACLSVPQLIRQFRSVFHTTPHRYLVKLRLEHAAHLLTTTTLPVREITWQCGFENPSAFCRAFRSAYNTQPQNFRDHASHTPIS
ncbi:MAG TPA: AraC family transcriptional regulator [Puia sp.]|nr:AraC family transcriptional regulator [Puia sp.]